MDFGFVLKSIQDYHMKGCNDFVLKIQRHAKMRIFFDRTFHMLLEKEESIDDRNCLARILAMLPFHRKHYTEIINWFLHSKFFRQAKFF